jgi:hypothetical protein
MGNAANLLMFKAIPEKIFKIGNLQNLQKMYFRPTLMIRKNFLPDINFVAKSKIYYFLLISLDRIPRIIIITI